MEAHRTSKYATICICASIIALLIAFADKQQLPGILVGQKFMGVHVHPCIP